MVDYNKAIELDPKLVLAYTNRAVAHENSGSVGAATTTIPTRLNWTPTTN